MNNHRKGINNRFNLQICYDPKFRTFTYSRALIVSYHTFDVYKTCPCFDAKNEYRGL